MRARHLRTLVIQACILISMAVLAVVDSNAYLVIVSVSLLILPPINWTVAGVLLWTTRQDPSVRSLADAADNALTLAISSTAAAFVALLILGRAVGILPIPVAVGNIISVMLGFIVVTSSLPAFRFLQTWREVWMPMVRIGRKN